MSDGADPGWPSGRGWRTPGTWLVPALCLAAAAAIALTGTNVSLFRAVNAWPATTGDGLWSHLTALGGGEVCGSLLFLAARRRPRLLADIVVAALVAGTLVVLVKELSLPSPRPLGVLGDDAVHLIGRRLKRNAMPSGHTATAFLVAAVAWRHLRSRTLAWSAVALAVAVALSRLAVGVHWPLDVTVGASLGWIGTLLAAPLVRHDGWSRHPAGRVFVRLAYLYAASMAAWGGGSYPDAELFTRAVGVAALLDGLPWWWRLLRWRRLPNEPSSPASPAAPAAREPPA